MQFDCVKEEIAADDRGKWCLAEMSAPEAKITIACTVTAILDTTSGLGTISSRVANLLQTKFPDVKMVAPMEDLQQM